MTRLPASLSDLETIRQLDTLIKLRLDLNTMELGWDKSSFECTVLNIYWKNRTPLSWGKGAPREVGSVLASACPGTGRCVSRQSRSLCTFRIFPGLCLDVLCSGKLIILSNPFFLSHFPRLWLLVITVSLHICPFYFLSPIAFAINAFFFSHLPLFR